MPRRPVTKKRKNFNKKLARIKDYVYSQSKPVIAKKIAKELGLDQLRTMELLGILCRQGKIKSKWLHLPHGSHPYAASISIYSIPEEYQPEGYNLEKGLK